MVLTGMGQNPTEQGSTEQGSTEQGSVAPSESLAVDPEAESHTFQLLWAAFALPN